MLILKSNFVKLKFTQIITYVKEYIKVIWVCQYKKHDQENKVTFEYIMIF